MTRYTTMTQEEWKEYVRNLEECEAEYPDSPTSNDSEVESEED